LKPNPQTGDRGSKELLNVFRILSAALSSWLLGIFTLERKTR
jgi:hypothetical protein